MLLLASTKASVLGPCGLFWIHSICCRAGWVA